MTFQVRLESPAIREAKIRASVQGSQEVREFYDFRNQKTNLRKIRVAENLLVYRMENFRTYTDQRAYIARERKPDNYFTQGQENESVQQQQHDILARLARKGRADSVIPIIDVLRVERQREPILVTTRGVVVNGNRRLAAMRELLDESRTIFTEFEHVDCLVLPEDATPDDIVDIEAALQGKPETRLDYDWVGDCQLIQRLLDIGRSPQQVAQRLNRKLSEIRNSLAAFSEATTYLKDWANAEGDYTRVRDAEQIFKDLPGILEGKDESAAEASRIVAWNLFENKDNLSERLYAFNVVVEKSAESVLDEVASEMGIALNEQQDDEEDGFAVDVDIESDRPQFGPVIEALKDPDRRAEALDVLTQSARNYLEQERGRRKGGAALKSAITANARLNEIDLGRADSSTYDSIDRQLDQILKRANELKSVLTRLRASQADPAPVQ